MRDQWRAGDQIRSIHPNVVIFEGVLIAEDVTIFPGSVIGRPPMSTGIVPPKEYIPDTIIGPGCVIGSNVTIYAGVTLEANVLIGDGARIRENTTIGEGSVVGSNSTIQNDAVIGRRVRIVDLSHITAGVTIEDDVFWSVGVLSMNDNRDGQGLKRMRIGAGSFIGGGALLLPGSDLGAGAMVAAGAVVPPSVEAGSAGRGVPARPWERKNVLATIDGWSVTDVEDR